MGKFPGVKKLSQEMPSEKNKHLNDSFFPENEPSPWWKIDLLSDRCVSKILVKGRDAPYGEIVVK